MGSTPAILIVWGILLASSMFVRRFMIQYVGDVVAYVYAFTLDRFFDIRQRIKDRANETARAVYGLLEGEGDAAKLYYRNVILCGHSLGSVVAYDTLNRLLDDDEAARTSGATIDVLGRTSMLLSFGSPLDKTAYLFRTQQNATGEAREALAASAQPLINDARFRPATFKWLNVFAPGGIDLIGASVDFYDAKLSLATPVQNVPDLDASIPVLAHSEHWDNKLIWRALHERIMTC
jgi:pimeloyl-ACP methyl ester carboxylesterase